MTPYVIEAEAWQESWDRQQEAYLPDREHRFAALLDAADAVTGDGPLRLLDLAGGTGSISLRALARRPGAQVTLVDLDPVLLTLAEASLSGRATIVATDLNRPEWTAALPHREYDAVLTATALHWLDGPRLAELYREIHDCLRPGGVFVNADHMPDDALPALTAQLTARARQRRTARHAAGAAASWAGWWEQAAADPTLGPLVEKRRQVYPTGHSPEWTPATQWHLDGLRAAGFREAGVLWRNGADAAVAAIA
ncbi:MULTISPECIES: class I SAM-dependent methyltransferase [unclassified Micromonospora]|uniref:class I SAM-dependent methyltransferase n=1 Tax=unclassified Micromonospora TaxID=2617518 RepID=UPI002FF1F37C